MELSGAVLALAGGATPLRVESALFEEMLASWRRQQTSRRLGASLIDRRERTVRRFQAFANGWPWGWRPEQLERWVAEGRWAHSTVRSYQGAVAAFCGYATDPRYGWVGECEQRVGARPSQIHEDNTATHVADYEGRPERRPLSRAECQALFDAADDRAERLAGAGSKGSLTAFRRRHAVEGDLRLGVALPGGDDAGPDRLHDESGGAGAGLPRGVSGALRQGHARFAAPSVDRHVIP